MDNVSIVKQYLVEGNTSDNPQTKHDQRVKQAIGKLEGGISNPATSELISIYRSWGFKIVKKDIESQFAYKAGINGSYVKRTWADDLSDSGKVFSYAIAFALIVGMAVSICLSQWQYMMLAIPSFLLGFILISILTSCYAGKSINYVGDIPDSILDKMDKLKSDEFMVYSNEPLPTEKFLAKTDSVMIAWINNSKCGILVGVWNEDKEIEV